MDRRLLRLLLACALLHGSVGCTGMLPRSGKSDSPFRSFDEVKGAFDAVELERTGREELAELRIDPERQGVRRLSGAQLIALYLPHDGATLALHADGVRRCAEAGARCEGWLVDVSRDRRRRTGTWLRDVLRFERVKEQRGFDFTGVLLLLDEVVIHKIWSGVPQRRMEATQVQPLGFLQSDTGVSVANPLDLPPFVVRVRYGASQGRARKSRFPGFPD